MYYRKGEEIAESIFEEIGGMFLSVGNWILGAHLIVVAIRCPPCLILRNVHAISAA